QCIKGIGLWVIIQRDVSLAPARLEVAHLAKEHAVVAARVVEHAGAIGVRADDRVTLANTVRSAPLGDDPAENLRQAPPAGDNRPFVVGRLGYGLSHGYPLLVVVWALNRRDESIHEAALGQARQPDTPAAALLTRRIQMHNCTIRKSTPQVQCPARNA